MTAPISLTDRDHILQHTADVWQELRGARLFITGGTGFVGTWLLEAFVAANRHYELGAQAVVLSRDPDRFRARLPHLANAPGIALLTGDAATFSAPAGPITHVIHAATQRFYPSDRERPLGILADDQRATRCVLALCETKSVRNLLFLSSGAAYGTQPAHCLQLRESDPFAPVTADTASVYGQSKRLSEFSCFMHGAVHGFGVTVARLFAFVGPHLSLDEGYAVGNFIRDVLVGDAIRIGGDGTPLRSYLYAADLAIWLWTMLVRGTAGRIYNVGSPHAISIAELARAVATAAQRDVPISIAQAATAGAVPQRYIPATERASAELALNPRIDLPEALRRTLQWHQHAARQRSAATL